MAMGGGKLVEQQHSCRHLSVRRLCARRSASTVRQLHRFAAPRLAAEDIWLR